MVVPPAAYTVADPSHTPKQDAITGAVILAVNTAGSVTVVELVAVHPHESVTVTE